ncbi:MAG TPA: response regulator [Polyangiaceae bacterium]|nr:response regulator [Polyangiaceae bacterium]
MTRATILLVEDNALTRKLVRFALERKGHSVLEATSGASALSLLESQAADLVLQDLVLPDVDGFELIKRLRALPNGMDAPILAFSGLLSKHDEARMATAGFDDVIAKPIEPARLLPILEGHLLAREPSADPFGKGKRLILADDEPLQLKLTRFRLEQAGFVVETAADGQEALEAARRAPPDGIVSDVLMPRLDGFGLAVAVRCDPRLVDVPVLLVTSSYLDVSDRELARRAGANELVLRTPNHRELFQALRKMLHQPSRSSANLEVLSDYETNRGDRVVRQLERQVMLNSRLARRCSALSAELAVLGGISAAVVKHGDVEAALDQALTACLEVGDISHAAIYFEEADEKIRARPLKRAESPELTHFWGHQAQLWKLMRGESPALFSSSNSEAGWTREILSNCAATLFVVAPLVRPSGLAGALFMALAGHEFDEDDWCVFTQAIANQVSQALALADSFAERDAAEKSATDRALRLRESEERFRATFERAAVGVAQVAPDGRWLDVNQRLCEIVGYSRDELLARTFQDITYPPDLEANVRLVERALSGEISSYSVEKRYLRKDGALVWANVTVGLVRDGAGQPKYFVPVIQDITARKKAEEELERTSAQLRQAQKMEAVGRLAGGIAHDFNNLLSVIQSYGEMLLNETLPNDRMRADIEQITRAGQRAADLTRQLLSFSRQQVLAPRVIELDDAIRDLSTMLTRVIGEDVEFRFLPGGAGRVSVDPGQLQQILMNLAVNARDAMPDGGVLTIATSEMTLRDELTLTERGLPSGKYALITVMDTGVGIDAATQSRMFEPFFTTKAPGAGSGLGLSTVFGIVEQSGGAVWVDSEPGKGATFSVCLPQAPRGARPSDIPPPSTKTRRGRERVLLVEDDDQVRALSKRILQSYGYVVLEAAAPEDALRICQASQEPIHLLLTDVVMPRLGGRELAERLTKMRPTMKVLFMSGYTDDAIVRQGVLVSEMAFIQKPLMPEPLLAKIREVLDAV